MQNASFKKLLLFLLLAAIVPALLLHFTHSKLKPQATAPSEILKPKLDHHYTPPALSVAAVKPEAEVKTESEATPQPKLPREKVEAWLSKHNRNAASLLAAFHALEDTNYLNEAAANFPNDPHVELAVLAHDEFPADRRKWLDLFKASSPSNSLADYFSAQDYFKNGKTDEAVQELLAASGKSVFDNHEMETQLNAEQLYQDSGKSPSEAASFALADTCGETLPELMATKQLDHGIEDLMKQKMDAGDADSAANLAQMGLALADKLNSGDSGKYLINQLVGMATESIVLRQLDQNTSYDFLNGQTPAQVLQQMKDQKKTIQELAGNFSAAEPNLTEGERVSYLQRWKIYGELEAMKWVVQQHPPTNP